MNLRQKIQKEIEKLQRQLDKLNRIPEDTFHFHTVLKFVTANNTSWFITKIDEEKWQMVNGTVAKTLEEWILQTEESPHGSFEVYVFTAGENPIYVKQEN